ncbi:MAG: ketoacyl-ACP synthase III [Epsilonproteobacteria bacterium]|nr:ketoacyl-ACP synthase III [Campylobacterota bacterium]
MAKLHFKDIKIGAIVTTTGNKKVTIEEEAANYGYDEKAIRRLKKRMGFNSRYVADKDVCTSDLCVESANEIFKKFDKDGIEALVFVTQTPDYKAPSTAIIMADRLGLGNDVIAYDINLGCSGFINGLLNSYSLINSGIKKVLLCVGDVASRFAYCKDKNLTPLMGDAGSAVLIEKKEGFSADFVLHSDGSGYEYLIIPDGGCRNPFSEDSLKESESEEGTRRGVDMYMNGGEIFNFTIKVVPKMFDELFEFADISKEDIDYFVLHQANRYILQNIAKRLGISQDKLPMNTMTIYGNQNSASIPGTINAFLFDKLDGRKKAVFAGFGIGLSWGACLMDLEDVYTPPIRQYKGA